MEEISQWGPFIKGQQKRFRVYKVKIMSCVLSVPLWSHSDAIFFVKMSHAQLTHEVFSSYVLLNVHIPQTLHLNVLYEHIIIIDGSM